MSERSIGGSPSITKEQIQKHADINRQIDEFFAKGGKKQVIEKGVSGETRPGAKKFIDHGRMYKPANSS